MRFYKTVMFSNIILGVNSGVGNLQLQIFDLKFGFEFLLWLDYVTKARFCASHMGIRSLLESGVFLWVGLHHSTYLLAAGSPRTAQDMPGKSFNDNVPPQSAGQFKLIPACFSILLDEC
jgi:hypothetical protein